MDEIKAVEEYLNRESWEVRENSNMTYSLQGLNFYLTSKVVRSYWLERIYPPEIAKAHVEGDIHIHDLQVLGVYCMGWDLLDLLMTGFRGVSGKVESRPPRHFTSALGQVVNFLYTLQGESAGAQALSNFDTLLAPFIRYDGLGYREVKQAVQEFVYNLNIPTRTGFQTPFTNLTFDVKVPAFLEDQAVIVGGEVKNETYGEFQEEVDMINMAFFEVMKEGDARGRVFTFPIPTYNITPDFRWDDPKLTGLWEMTAKYGIPYFANFVSSDMKPEDVRSMCCRLRLETRELLRRGGGYFGANPLTGSIGVVTINLPRIGYLSDSEEEFFERLVSLMDLAKESLEVKRRVLENLMEKGLYPYSKFYLRTVKERFGEFWKNHFSTVGLVGMNEACLNLLGVSIADPRGREFALKVLDLMREKLLMEATPAEGASYRLARLDRERFPDIVVANEDEVRRGAEPFYTNSTQLPVSWTDDPFEVLQHQEELQTKYTGGTVIHFFIGERLRDVESLKHFVRKVCESYRIPYFTVTPPVSQWNAGKQEEFRLRRYYRISR